MKRYLYIASAFLVVIAMHSCETEDFGGNDPRDNITDTWKADENKLKSALATYPVDIVNHENDSSKVLLYNFNALGDNIYVEARYNNNILTISNFRTSDGYRVNGTGTVSSRFRDITWTYTVDPGDGPEEFNAVFTRNY